ncbi:T9 SSC-terminaltarget domain-containing protein [Haloferula helveola]|uniref:T9 SSC-terminaltarget domain-containing protein n=1 Tax=Haloferula helveola TaxID=490095 RepID=A0ABM7RDC2_9BACT|nr:T9 SSC-terminaltarget domain-containing protein [Haloferula helveola]
MIPDVYRLAAITLVAGLTLLAPAAAGAEPEYSKLWGKDGELWKPDGTHTKLLDFTDVGYMQGDVRIPDWPVGVDIRDFGAVGDGEHDDTQAFVDAIDACPPKTAVFIPEGRYMITRQIVIEKDHIVLRGEDMYGSVLWFPKYLTEIYKFEEGYLPEKLMAVAYDENGKSYLGRSLYEEFPAHDKDGTPVKLPKPLTRLARGGHPKNSGFIRMQGGTHKCIENLSFEFRDQKKGDHWEFVGADPVKYFGVTDAWIRNVHVRNADHGITINKGRQISIINIFLDSYPLRGGGGGAIGHMGINLSDTNHCLIHNVETTGLWIHDMVSTGGMKKVVWSRISGYDLKLDHHSMGGMHDLYTEIDHGKGSRPFSSSKLETYWGLSSRRPIPYARVKGPEKDPKRNVVVGMRTDDPSETGEEHLWETLDPAKLHPRNIYIAQLQKKGKPLPDYPMPERPYASGEPRVFFPVDDADVTQGSDRNSGGSRQLAISSSKGEHKSSAYVKFDLKACGIERAERAVLKIFGGKPPHQKGKSPAKGQPMRLHAHAVDDDSWNEYAIHANNAPASEAALAKCALGFGEWHELDITDFVNRQLAGDDVISLRLTGDPEVDGKAAFNSSDSGDPPHLVITPEVRDVD